MNVLVIAPHAFYIDRGSPIDLDILLRALSLRGERIEALVYRAGEDRDYPNVTLHRIWSPRFFGDVPPGFSLRKLFCDVLLFFKARRLARRGQFDVVHAVEEAVFIAMYLKRTRGVPYVYDMDSSIAQQMIEQMPYLRPLAPFFSWCEARALAGSLAAAPVCNALAEVARRGQAPHIETLHDISQLDVERLEPTDELRRRAAPGACIALYVGNLKAYQGIDLLLESMPTALARRPKIELFIAGGSETDIRKYRRKAKSLGVADAVQFLGPWPVEELGRLLVAADVLVAPRSKGVNTPMKVFPYLHSGRAVLATDLPTHNQLLDDSVVRLAPAEPVPFGEALAELAADDELRRRLGHAGRGFVERNHVFSAHRRRVDRLYEHVASWRGPSEPRTSPAASVPRGEGS